jgi:hypothetical protein
MTSFLPELVNYGGPPLAALFPSLMGGWTVAPREAPAIPHSVPTPDVPERHDDAIPGAYQLTHLITVWLTLDNYLYRRAQILPLLRSRHLDDFIDGSTPCPPRTVAAYTAEGTRVAVANPLYRACVAQDQAIVSVLQSSLIEGVAGLVLFANSAQDIWSTLEHSLSQQSTACSTALHRQLSECKKLESSVHDYNNNVKTLSDTLTSIGQPLRDAEFTEYVLAGLDSYYDNLVKMVNNRDNPMPPRDLYSRLMYTEQLVEARRTTPVIVDSAAHAAYHDAP